MISIKQINAAMWQVELHQSLRNRILEYHAYYNDLSEDQSFWMYQNGKIVLLERAEDKITRRVSCRLNYDMIIRTAINKLCFYCNELTNIQCESRSVCDICLAYIKGCDEFFSTSTFPYPNRNIPFYLHLRYPRRSYRLTIINNNTLKVILAYPKSCERLIRDLLVVFSRYSTKLKMMVYESVAIIAREVFNRILALVMNRTSSTFIAF